MNNTCVHDLASGLDYVFQYLEKHVHLQSNNMYIYNCSNMCLPMRNVMNTNSKSNAKESQIHLHKLVARLYFVTIYISSKVGCLYFQVHLFLQIFLCTVTCKDGGLETWAIATCVLCNWSLFSGIKTSIANICKCSHVFHVVLCEWPTMWLKGLHMHWKCSKIRKKNKDLIRICTTWKLRRKINI